MIPVDVVKMNSVDYTFQRLSSVSSVVSCRRMCCIKTAFHYSSQLQTWLQVQTWFSTRFATRFSTSSCGFVTRFRLFFVENLVANLLHQSRRAVVTRFQASLQLAFDLLSTCFRPACDVLSTRSRKSKARFAAC